MPTPKLQNAQNGCLTFVCDASIEPFCSIHVTKPVLSLHCPSQGIQLYVRGLISSGSQSEANNETGLEKIISHYLNHGELLFDQFEGSYTIYLIDSTNRNVLVYRSMASAGNTFYRFQSGTFAFASNLADLINLEPSQSRLNEESLPKLFVFRYMIGNETLVKDVFRLMPGEQLKFSQSKLSVEKKVTLASFRESVVQYPPTSKGLNDLMQDIAKDQQFSRGKSGVLFSGGVDSSYIQAVWGAVRSDGPHAYSVAVDHERTDGDREYAISAAKQLRCQLSLVPASSRMADNLIETIKVTAELPNHVQACYFLGLARKMAEDGVTLGLCGEAADGVLGMSTANYIQNAILIRKLLAPSIVRRFAADVLSIFGWNRPKYYVNLCDQLDDLSYFNHPVNQQTVFTDWSTYFDVFGQTKANQVLAYRRDIVVDQNSVKNNLLHRLHASNFFTSSIDSASYWSTLFDSAGVALYCPFLDSRFLKWAEQLPTKVRFPFRNPKGILKEALALYLPKDYVNRKKRGFGQPIFEWMSRGGQLWPLVEDIDDYGFIKPDQLSQMKLKPNWFLYSLLCLDLWIKNCLKR